MKTKFFFCKHCGNVVVKFVDSGVVPSCCGEPMTELVPLSSDGPVEKHLPVLVHPTDDGHPLPVGQCSDLIVKVGSVEHPMTPDHHIQFIFVETLDGGFLHQLDPADKPCASFSLHGHRPVAVYAYCNLHGLWMTKV